MENLQGTEKQIKFANDLLDKIKEAKKITTESIAEYGYDYDEYRNTKSAGTMHNRVNKMFRVVEEIESKLQGIEDAGDVIDIIYGHPQFSSVKVFRTV